MLHDKFNSCRLCILMGYVALLACVCVCVCVCVPEKVLLQYSISYTPTHTHTHTQHITLSSFVCFLSSSTLSYVGSCKYVRVCVCMYVCVYVYILFANVLPSLLLQSLLFVNYFLNMNLCFALLSSYRFFFFLKSAKKLLVSNLLFIHTFGHFLLPSLFFCYFPFTRHPFTGRIFLNIYMYICIYIYGCVFFSSV